MEKELINDQIRSIYVHAYRSCLVSCIIVLILRTVYPQYEPRNDLRPQTDHRRPRTPPCPHSSTRDQFTIATIPQNFKPIEGKSLTFPSVAEGPKPEYLVYPREQIFQGH